MEYAQLLDTSTVWIIDNALNVAVAIAVLVGGFFLAGFVGRHAGDFLPKTRAIDKTIAPLLSQVARYGIMIVTVVIVLSQFGVNTASILAVLGAAGLAIALALQGTLSNMAAGIMMIWLRPFNVGEYVDADGVAGTVLEIELSARACVLTTASTCLRPTPRSGVPRLRTTRAKSGAWSKPRSAFPMAPASPTLGPLY